MCRFTTKEGKKIYQKIEVEKQGESVKIQDLATTNRKNQILSVTLGSSLKTRLKWMKLGFKESLAQCNANAKIRF